MKKILLISLITINVLSAYAQTVIKENDGFEWVRFQQNGYTGAKSKGGKLLVPANYQEVIMDHGVFAAKSAGGWVGVYDKKGKVIIRPNEFTAIKQIENGEKSSFCAFNGGFGVYSYNGKEMISPTCQCIQPMLDSGKHKFLTFLQNGYMGIADSKGNVVIPADKYHNIMKYGNESIGYTYVCQTYDSGCDVLDAKGKILISTKYYLVFKNGDGYAVVDGNSEGRLDAKGNVIIAPKQRKNATELVLKNGKKYHLVMNEQNLYGITSLSGEKLVPCYYNQIIPTENNGLMVVKGRYTGYLNADCKEIVSTNEKYLFIAESADCLRVTDENRNIGEISYDGKLLLAPAHHFQILQTCKDSNGVTDSTIVYKDDKYLGLETTKREKILPDLFTDISVINTYAGIYYPVLKENAWGVYNKEGRMVIYPSFKQITLETNGDYQYFRVDNGNKQGIYTLEGNPLINPEIFSNITYNSGTKTFRCTEGKRICVVSINGKVLSDNLPTVKCDEYTSIADKAFEGRNYEEAAKYYGLALREKSSPCLYFNRGVSYYNMDRYIDAINDFEKCLNNNPSQRLIDRSRDCIRKARIYQQEKEFQREQTARAIFGFVLGVANTYIQAKSTTQIRNTGTYSSRSSSSYSDNDYDNNDKTDSYSLQRSPRLCRTCKGDGKCLSCHGDGIRTDNQFGYGKDPTHKCGVCGGDGICNICHGNGKI